MYVLDCEGRTVEGWPLQMGAVQAQVAVADINGDGALEIVAADARGNVAAFSADGSELWERHVKSLVAQVGPLAKHLARLNDTWMAVTTSRCAADPSFHRNLVVSWTAATLGAHVGGKVAWATPMHFHSHRLLEGAFKAGFCIAQPCQRPTRPFSSEACPPLYSCLMYSCTGRAPERCRATLFLRPPCHLQAPSLGDINGDGVLEVVFASASGAVYALSGISGRDVAPFPFRTRGRITAPVLLVRLRDSGPALHAVVQSYDGHLYAIDGVTGGAAMRFEKFK